MCAVMRCRVGVGLGHLTHLLVLLRPFLLCFIYRVYNDYDILNIEQKLENKAFNALVVETMGNWDVLEYASAGFTKL